MFQISNKGRSFAFSGVKTGIPFSRANACTGEGVSVPFRDDRAGGWLTTKIIFMNCSYCNRILRASAAILGVPKNYFFYYLFEKKKTHLKPFSR